MSKMGRLKFLKALLIFLFLSTIFFLTSCDETLVDVYTQINSNYSGTRTVDLAVKTQYLQKGEVILNQNESLNDKLLKSLPPGKIETSEKDQYTHFKSTIEFNDINFLQHISIDNYSEVPPVRFYAKMEKKDYFFHTDYFFYDYIDMKVDDALIESSGKNGDLARIDSLFKANKDLLKITYQVKLPVKIVKTNADIIGNNNIAIWNLKYGDQKNITIEGKKIKFLSYFLLVLLGLIGLFVIFIIFALIYSRRRRRISRPKKPIYAYDNYFKKDGFFDQDDK